MRLSKLKLCAAVVVAIIVTGGGVLLSPSFGAGPGDKPRPVPAPPAAVPPAPRPVVEREYQINVTFAEEIDGKRDVLSAPRIVALAGQAANVQIGGAQVVEGDEVIEQVPIGLTATFTVTPEKSGKLRVDVSVAQTRPVDDKAGPTWRSRSLRAIRRVTPGKPETMELAADTAKQPALVVTLTVTEWHPDAAKVAPPISAADRDMRAAEFYRRIGHPGAARFYYELILRRYDGTPAADTARERLKGLTDSADPAKDGEPFRIGGLYILGNTRTADRDILDRFRLSPGQVLHYKDVQEAESRLAKMRAFKSPPKVTIKDVEEPSQFKDILIIVEEK
jgi:hypothetical protein